MGSEQLILTHEVNTPVNIYEAKIYVWSEHRPPTDTDIPWSVCVCACVCVKSADNSSCLNMTFQDNDASAACSHTETGGILSKNMVSAVQCAPWSCLITQQSDRIILSEHYGNNIRLPKHYSMAGGKPSDKWYDPLAGCTAGYYFPPPSNNNHRRYNNQSNFKLALCCLSYTHGKTSTGARAQAQHS